MSEQIETIVNAAIEELLDPLSDENIQGDFKTSDSDKPSPPSSD